MTGRPIIFSAPMVRALLDGRKTMTRRLAWTSRPGAKIGVPADDRVASPWQRVVPGDRLWVREAWAKVGDNADDIHACPDLRRHFYYRAESKDETVKWRSPIHMTRWASRLTLTVTAVKIGRLQEMTAGDAEAEGVEYETADPPFWYVPGIWPHSLTAVGIEEPGATHHAVRSFAKLWDHLNGEASWEANPEIVALTFTVARRNIDAPPP